MRGANRRALATFALAAALLAACGDRQQAGEPSAPLPAPTGPGITIALLPERNVFDQKKRYQPLQEYLSRALAMPVTFKLLDSYQVIFSELLERRVEGAFFGSMNGAIAMLKGGVEILARPVDLKGVSTYSGLVFARTGTGVTLDPKTWKGKRFALVNRATTAGYLYPLSLMRQAGYAGEPEAYFDKLVFTGSHDAAILSVFNGETDAGACKNTIYDEYERLHPELARTVVVLGESTQVPSNGLGVRPDLDPALRRRLREALLGMNGNEEGQRALQLFQAQRFVATSASDYQPVLDMAREAGLDLAAWPLRDIR